MGGPTPVGKGSWAEAPTEVGRLAKKRTPPLARDSPGSSDAEDNLADARITKSRRAQDRSDMPPHVKQGKGASQHARRQPQSVHNVLPYPRQRGFRPAQGQCITRDAHMPRAAPERRPPPALPSHQAQTWTAGVVSNICAAWAKISPIAAKLGPPSSKLWRRAGRLRPKSSLDSPAPAGFAQRVASPCLAWTKLK